MADALTDEQWREILRRNERLQGYAPPCPSCASEQVQRVSGVVEPARFKCRRCKRVFVSEPESK